MQKYPFSRCDAYQLSEYITVLPALSSPLSADVFIVRGASRHWIFDVGNHPDHAADLIQIHGHKAIFLSHFHPDHMGNLGLIEDCDIFCGAHTRKYTDRSVMIIQNPVVFHDGIELKCFPVPSSHAKGCIGLEIDGEYAFLGDATYCTMKGGKAVYNVNLLKELIDLIRNLHASWLLTSHSIPLIRSKEEVLGELLAVYNRRTPHFPYVEA